MAYITIKTLHILSSVLLVGTGFGSAFYLYFANRTHSVHAIAVVSRLVVRADWYFTAPTVILQPLTGALMVWMGHWPLRMHWLIASIGLYALAGACWLPVVVYQMKMARIAEASRLEGATLPAIYWKLARRWELLGYPAFLAMIAIYFLMVAKPS
jgi:uncharacterized membrane protein